MATWIFWLSDHIPVRRQIESDAWETSMILLYRELYRRG